MDMILSKCQFSNCFSLFSVTYVVGKLWNCLIDAILMCIYNIFNKCVFRSCCKLHSFIVIVK